MILWGIANMLDFSVFSYNIRKYVKIRPNGPEPIINMKPVAEKPWGLLSFSQEKDYMVFIISLPKAESHIQKEGKVQD